MTLALYGKSRRRQVLLVVLGLVAAALAVVSSLHNESNPAAAGSSQPLLPTANGFYTNWNLFPSGAAWEKVVEGSCTASDTSGVQISSESTHNKRTFDINETTIPNGRTITRVDVTYCYGAMNTNVGARAFTPMVRVGSTDTFGTQLDFAGPTTAGVVTPTLSPVQQITVSHIKSATTDLEIGALWNAGNVRIYAIWAVVHWEDPALPNLTVSKAPTRNGSPVTSIADDQTFQWRWNIANEGEAAAVFDSGEVVLRDELPAGITYSSPSNFGNISCSVAAGVFTCVANGTLTIEPDTSLSVGVAADPAAAGAYTNTASNCQVDYLAGNTNGIVVESDETDNSCAADATIQVLERRHPRVCLRLVDDGDATAGETATVLLGFHNVTTGSLAGASNKSYTEAPEAAPITAGECSDLSMFPVGTVIRVTTTVIAPPDFTFATGYPIARLYPAADPTPPSPEVEFTVGLGDCGVDKNGESVIANDTCNLHLFVKTAPSAPPVVAPTVSKTASAVPVAGGLAYWDITIDQPAEDWAEQTVVITDAHDDIQLVGEAPCTLDGAEITCEVGEEDVTFTVSRPITAETLTSGTLCAGGIVANHLPSATAAGNALEITGGSSPVAIDVRDTSACAPPSVTKTLVPDGESSVTDTADVRWLITLANPSGGLAGVPIEVRDTDATLLADSATSSPAGNVETWCEVQPAPFEAACELPSGATVTFVVVPSSRPPLQCESKDYANVAEYRFGGAETWSEAAGPVITLLGAKSECPQDITIVKRLLNVPEGREVDPEVDLPELTVPDGTLVSGPTEVDDNTYAWVYTVPPRYTGEVTETVPEGWEPVACAANADGAYTTFCNQPLASIVVTKLYTPNGGPDATDDDLPLSITLEGHGAFIPVGPTAGNETTYAAKPVSAGRFTVTELLTPGWHTTGASVAGNGCVEVFPETLFEALQSELVRAIGLLHGANSITFDTEPGSECQVTFTNERLIATIVVDKVYLGADGDTPEIAVEIDGVGDGGAWTETGEPTTRWAKVVSVSAGGSNATITETIPAGWANVRAIAGSCDGVDTSGAPVAGETASVVLESVTPGDTATVCFVNVAVGQVQLLKLDTVDSGQTDSWSFTSTAPGVGSMLQTAHSDEPAQAQRATALVPVGEYTISETGGGSACLPGALASDFETRAAASVGTPPLDEDTMTVVGGAGVPFAVEKGQTTYLRFDNVGCGTVLGTGLIVVWKFADFDRDGVRDANEPPVPSWPFTISGPDGTFEVLTDAEGKHVFTVAKGGVYTVVEQAADGWLPIGSSQGGTLTPGTSASVTAGLGQQREVSFFNQPRVNIEVTKTEFSNADPAGVPGEGWEFTLTGCGIAPRTGTTGTDGTLLFADLPPAVGCSYTVTETQIGGWAAVTSSRTTSPNGPGETAGLGFRNIRIEGCPDCVPTTTPGTTPTPTATPSATPSPTQPSAGDGSPTATPTTPTPEPSITAVAGDRTPGPAATPIAPNTGAGLQGAGGQSFLLWLLGSAAVATGLLVLRLSRRRM